MTGRDRAWRAAGAAVTAGSCLLAQLGIGGGAGGLLWFVAANAGLVLLVNGHRVATVIRAERGGHALTAGAVHAARLRRLAERRERRPLVRPAPPG